MAILSIKQKVSYHSDVVLWFKYRDYIITWGLWRFPPLALVSLKFDIFNTFDQMKHRSDKANKTTVKTKLLTREKYLHKSAGTMYHITDSDSAVMSSFCSNYSNFFSMKHWHSVCLLQSMTKGRKLIAAHLLLAQSQPVRSLWPDLVKSRVAGRTQPNSRAWEGWHCFWLMQAAFRKQHIAVRKVYRLEKTTKVLGQLLKVHLLLIASEEPAWKPDPSDIFLENTSHLNRSCPQFPLPRTANVKTCRSSFQHRNTVSKQLCVWTEFITAAKHFVCHLSAARSGVAVCYRTASLQMIQQHS